MNSKSKSHSRNWNSCWFVGNELKNSQRLSASTQLHNVLNCNLFFTFFYSCVHCIVFLRPAPRQTSLFVSFLSWHKASINIIGSIISPLFFLPRSRFAIFIKRYETHKTVTILHQESSTSRVAGLLFFGEETKKNLILGLFMFLFSFLLWHHDRDGYQIRGCFAEFHRCLTADA